MTHVRLCQVHHPLFYIQQVWCSSHHVAWVTCARSQSAAGWCFLPYDHSWNTDLTAARHKHWVWCWRDVGELSNTAADQRAFILQLKRTAADSVKCHIQPALRCRAGWMWHFTACWTRTSKPPAPVLLLLLLFCLQVCTEPGNLSGWFTAALMLNPPHNCFPPASIRLAFSSTAPPCHAAGTAPACSYRAEIITSRRVSTNLLSQSKMIVWERQTELLQQ